MGAITTEQLPYHIVHDGEAFSRLRLRRHSPQGTIEEISGEAKVAVLRKRNENELYLGIVYNLDDENDPPTILFADIPLNILAVWRAMKAAENLQNVRVAQDGSVPTLNQLSRAIRSQHLYPEALTDLAFDFGMKLDSVGIGLWSVKQAHMEWPELSTFCIMRRPLEN